MSGPDSGAAPTLKAYRADENAAGQRLDQFLAAAAGPDLSRSRVQALIKAGAVTVNGRVATEPKTKLAGSEEIVIDAPPPAPPEPQGEDIALDVLYEDADVIVVNKPAGLVVHPGAGNPTGTLVNALISHCGVSLSGIGGVARPGIVHRLDKDTSGVMVVAKNDNAHRLLSEAFADHGRTGDLERAYLALVWGAPRQSGTIETYLGRSSRDRLKQAVVREEQPDARHAVTHYEVQETYGPEPQASLVECRLETGRTHQIRVHMAHIGNPLIGDRDYGAAFKTKANKLPDDIRATVDGFGRQALHAYLLAFPHPSTGEVMQFEAPLPNDMAQLVEAMSRLL
ncbi:MAG: RluA family pseudouridine synthase [Mesorhizobium sp.]